MKYYLSFLFLLMIRAIPGFCQVYDFPGVNTVHFADSNSYVIAEVAPENTAFKAHPDLTYSWYLSNEIHVSRGGYAGRLLHGQYTEFYHNHNLKIKGSYTDGLKNGVFEEWLSDGSLVSYISWKNGFKHGEYRLYNTAGQLIEKGNYRNGKKDSKAAYYSADSVTTGVGFKGGKLNSVPDSVDHVDPDK